MNQQDQQFWIGQVVAVGSILGSLAGLLPTLAAIVALVWYILLIYESKTMVGWRQRRRHKRLNDLEAQRLRVLEKIKAARVTESPEGSDDPAAGPGTA